MSSLGAVATVYAFWLLFSAICSDRELTRSTLARLILTCPALSTVVAADNTGRFEPLPVMDAGSPQPAPPEILAAVNARMALVVEKRTADVRAAVAALGE